MKKLSTALLIILTVSYSSFAAENWRTMLGKADSELRDKNSKDAFFLYKKILLDYKANPHIYLNAVESLRKARLENEFDDLFAAVAKKYGKGPYMAVALAKSKMRVSDFGYIIAGKFVRGYHRG
jgi:hypothetical protein